MTDMFCFQCQQTAGNKGCIRTGVCGKQPTTANLQDELVYELICLAETMAEKNMRTKEADRLFIDGLFTTLTNVNFDNEALLRILQSVEEEKKKLVPDCYACAASCGKNNDYDMKELWNCGMGIQILFLCVLLYFLG